MKKLFTLLLLFLIFNSTDLFSQSSNCLTATQANLTNGTVCVNGSNVGAITDNILYGSCNTVPVNMVWYTYVTNGSNNSFTINPGTLTNAMIVIYLGGCPNTGTLQNCVTATGSAPVITSWGMAAGSQVWIGIASTSLNDGTFQFCINSQAPAVSAGNTCNLSIPVCKATFTQASIPSNSSGQLPACFGNPPQQDIWIKFIITQPGLLAWTATPLNLATEFDWALWDISGGCPGTLACCNYNYAAGSSNGFGMQTMAGSVPCGYNLSGPKAQEFSPPINVSCGKIYAVQISNYSNNNTGFTLSFINSTCLITSNSAFTAAPAFTCAATLNATIVNASTGTCMGQTWNYGDGSALYNGTTPPAHTYTAPGTYAITASIGGVCPSTATQFVQLLAPLAASVSPGQVNCNGQCTGTASITAVSGGDGIYTYLWSTSSTSNTVSALCPGTYSVTISNAKCGSSITKTVSIINPPLLTLTATPSNATCGNANGSILVNASGGTPSYSFSINGGAFTSTTNFTGLGPGTYTLAAMDSKGCLTTATTSITQTLPPTVSVNSATVCAGAPAILTASGATTYSWSPATALSSTTGTSVTASPAITTSYTVTGTTGACSGTATAVVTVYAQSTPTAGNTGPYCPGNTIILSASTANSYTWSGPSAFTSNLQNPSIASASVSNSGIYTVSVTTAQGCVNSTTTNVVVNPDPVINISSNSPVCLGFDILLSSGGGTGYAWTGPNAFTSAAQNPTITGATLANSGIYTVTVTQNGCASMGTVNVTVTTPTTSASNTGPYCTGTTIQLNAANGTGYSWTGPNGFSSTQQNPVLGNATTLMSGTYSVIVAMGTCTAQASTSVTVNPLPAIAFTNTNVLCNGGNTGASTGSASIGTGPFSYLWSNGATTQTAGNLTNGTYSLTVTDANGCSSTSITTITQPPALSLTINSNSLSACANTSISLTGVAAGGTGPSYTYTWSPGPMTSAYSVTENAGGNYTYNLTGADQNGCTVTSAITLTFFPLPPVTATSATICVGDKTSLTAGGASTYTWSPGNVTGNTYTYSGVSDVTVSVTGSANGCVNQATASVKVNPLPVANVTSLSKTGCVPVCMSFTCNTSSSVQSVEWNFEDGGAIVTNSVVAEHCYGIAGTYSISAQLTDVNGCKTSSSYTIEVYPKPVADFNYAPYKPIVNNADVTFTDASFGANVIKWDWYFKNIPKPHSSLQNPTFVYEEEGTYAIALVVTSDHGCMDTIIQTIIIGPDYGIYVPNVFTPNGDGLNDIFQPKGFGIVKYELQIFDRWGEQLMHTNEFTEGWDGVYKGKLSQDGAYTWMINLTNVFGKSHELTGHVILMK